MAANLKSTVISNRDATPKVLTDSFINAGKFSESYGYVFTGASDSAGSTYKLAIVPSNARLSELSWINGALGSGCLLDVAVWYPTTVPQGGGNFLTVAGGTLVSSSAFSTALVGNTANATQSSLLSTAQQGPNYQEMPFWQLLGLASDPEIPLDVGFSVRVAVASAGYVGLRARFML